MPSFVALVFLLLPFISSSIHAEDGVPKGADLFVKGRILVKINPKLSLKAVQIKNMLKAKKVKNYSLIDGLHLYEFDPSIDVMEAIRRVKADNSVQYAEPDYLYHVATRAFVNDPEYHRQWALKNLGQTGGLVDADINAEESWALETGDPNVVIGIIDTGVDYTHPDLAQNMWKNPGEIPNDGKDNDGNGFVDDVYGVNTIKNIGNPMDDNRHGTHVAGTIGAVGNNDLGVVGIAHNIKMAACKFLSKGGSGSVSDAIECMQYFADLKSRKDNPVNLVATNNSWGGGGFSQSMYDAIKAHERLGIIFVAAAGNSSSNNDLSAFYPATYDLSNVISVASTDHADNLSSFSNYGKKTVHVAAPGSGILSTVLNGEYSSLSGTSMATPHVTGLLGLIASYYPSLDYKGIKNLAIAGGQKIDALNGKTISGRRIRGADKDGVGSLTCHDQTLVVKNQTLSFSYNIKVGDTLPLSALNINCELEGRDLVLYSLGLENIVLKDDGLNGDKTALDGISSLDWQPTKAGVYQLKFSEDDIVTVNVKEADEKKKSK